SVTARVLTNKAELVVQVLHIQRRVNLDRAVVQNTIAQIDVWRLQANERLALPVEFGTIFCRYIDPLEVRNFVQWQVVRDIHHVMVIGSASHLPEVVPYRISFDAIYSALRFVYDRIIRRIEI